MFGFLVMFLQLNHRSEVCYRHYSSSFLSVVIFGVLRNLQSSDLRQSQSTFCIQVNSSYALATWFTSSPCLLISPMLDIPSNELHLERQLQVPRVKLPKLCLSRPIRSQRYPDFISYRDLKFYFRNNAFLAVEELKQSSTTKSDVQVQVNNDNPTEPIASIFRSSENQFLNFLN